MIIGRGIRSRYGRLPWKPMAPIVALSTISVAPAFFVGALGVDIRSELGFGTAALGLAVSIYFLATALTTRTLGAFADRVGGRQAGVIAVLLVSGCLIGIAVSPSWWVLAGVLIVGGMGNALAGPTTSLLLARQIPLTALGLAFGVKQSSVPLATLAAGLAVPLVAASVPWQWVSWSPELQPCWSSRSCRIRRARRSPKLGAIPVHECPAGP